MARGAAKGSGRGTAQRSRRQPSAVQLFPAEVGAEVAAADAATEAGRAQAQAASAIATGRARDFASSNDRHARNIIE